MPRRLVTAAVLAHLVVMLVHGVAHARLNIELLAWQQSYVALVIGAAPLVAAVLLWTRQVRPGLFLLLGAMAGSLIFGGYFHYVAVSPDHVSHLPPGDAQGLFRVTAVLLMVTEAFGLVVGLFGLQTLRSRA